MFVPYVLYHVLFSITARDFDPKKAEEMLKAVRCNEKMSPECEHCVVKRTYLTYLLHCRILWEFSKVEQ